MGYGAAADSLTEPEAGWGRNRPEYAQISCANPIDGAENST